MSQPTIKRQALPVAITIVIIELFALQLLRIGTKYLVFSYIGKSVFSDTLVSAGFMLVVSIILLIYVLCTDMRRSLLPSGFSGIYTVFTCICLFVFLSSVFFALKGEKVIIAQTHLLYGALITPLFEELVFRCVIWKQLDCDNRRFGFLINAVLFGLWHIGYVDGIIYRTSVFSPGADIANIMLWKVITGLCIGIVLCIARKKSKNAFLPFLIHCLINSVGS